MRVVKEHREKVNASGKVNTKPHFLEFFCQSRNGGPVRDPVILPRAAISLLDLTYKMTRITRMSRMAGVIRMIRTLLITRMTRGRKVCNYLTPSNLITRN